MQNDRNTRETDMRDERMRDRNVTDSSHQENRDTRTMQRSRTERGEIPSNQEIDDDAMEDATRSQIGAGE